METNIAAIFKALPKIRARDLLSPEITQRNQNPPHADTLRQNNAKILLRIAFLFLR